MRAILAAVVVAGLHAVPAFAQTDWHLYGGGVLGGKEWTRGAFGGSGAAAGSLYAGVDGHGLWLNDEGKTAFRQLARSTGADLTMSTYGMDVSIGGVYRNATGRLQLIPVALVGFTTGAVEACYGSFCDDDTMTDANFGGGFIVAAKGEGGNGLHVGFRYTRNYGAAVSVGYIFEVD